MKKQGSFREISNPGLQAGDPTRAGHGDISNPGLQAGDQATSGPEIPAFAGMTGWSVHTLIIGSGAAALNAALCLWESGVRDILIVTEEWGGGTSNNAGSDKQTYYKLSLDPSVSDSASDMASDLSRGGAMHGDIALCEAQHSLQAFYNLVRLGVPFPHNAYGAYPGYKTDHDPRARATSAGPLTSHLMFGCLARKVEEYKIPVQDRVVIVELLTKQTPEGKVITGAIGLKTDTNSDLQPEAMVFHAPNVILATGGPAGIYRDSVYPVSQTGSTGLALIAGAKAQNLSLSQFGIASSKFRWNLSGSYQQVIPRYYSVNPDGIDEQEFLIPHFPEDGTLYTAIFLKGYQWPFDSKKIENHGSSLIDLLVQKESASGRRVYLDFTLNPSGFSIEKLQPVAREYLEKSGALAETPIDRLRLLNQPAIDLYLSHGIDITREPLEIAVCAQHSNGGLTGDIWWESNIRGLFPIGEVNGSHGITRPGGAALNAGQVGGIRAAMKIVNSEWLLVNGITETETNPCPPITNHQSPITSHFHRIESLMSGTGTLHHRTALAELRQRMSDHGGPVRNRETIRAQVKKAWELWKRINEDLMEVPPAELVEALRTFDLCLTHAVYLEAIAEYLDKSENEEFIQRNILEIGLDDNQAVIINWVPVRPIPQEELWFEKVWKEFRRGDLRSPVDVS
jgi:succinate dehydrogenase/fumarate reductase flavoprotein subunit